MSPKRTKPASRAKRKAAPRKVAAKRGAAKKKVAPKRSAAKKKVAPKRSATAKRKTAPKRRTTAKRKAAPKRASRATLRLVLKPRPAIKAAKPRPAVPRPFAGATEGASAKDLVIFDLVRARVEVQGAIQGMVGASAETPVAENKWTPRQIVLHLHYWDREMLPYLEKAYLHNERPPHTKDQILSENESSQHELENHGWDEAKRLMQHSRETFLEALQSLPEEPAEMWSSEHALGWLIRLLSHHDRHHAAILKEARSRSASS